MIDENTKIAIYGLGYIGLPTAALFANSGLAVTGVARNKDRLNLINMGKSPIIETGLDELVYNAVKTGKLHATDDGLKSAENSDVMIVIVPTPMDNYNRSDLSAVISTCEIIGEGLDEDNLVIVESTVPQGTCNNIVIPLLEKNGLKAGEDFGVVYTPERAIPNNTLYEMTHNARVIGGINKESVENATSLYKRIIKGEIIKVTDLMTAETIKLIENTYRDVNIALSNEIATICEGLGIDAIEAINAANLHPRVNIHTPGPGVGGHCLAIDPYFIVETAEAHGMEAPIIKTARRTNEGMPNHVIKLVLESLNEINSKIEDSKIGILGVAYKGNVADARETPAKPLIKILNDIGAKVYAHDPHVPENIIKSMGAKPVDLQDVLNCDCVVLMTDHDIYRKINAEMIKSLIFICTRPILNPEDFRNKGIIFRGVGR